ncbi:hypothetical protein ABT352_22740 [Streptosporangium sp. NPDC000563]|uniref:hypothetical protein n=1 Tax=Streptosporangium sp. NPDC000563 TaxID=3154366 RepID=UPI003328F3E4
MLSSFAGLNAKPVAPPGASAGSARSQRSAWRTFSISEISSCAPLPSEAADELVLVRGEFDAAECLAHLFATSLGDSGGSLAEVDRNHGGLSA